MLIDGEEKKAGSILEDFEPAVNPPEEIDDPDDSKPEDWVDTPKCAHLISPASLWIHSDGCWSPAAGPCLHACMLPSSQRA
jgi:hypothetical protein